MPTAKNTRQVTGMSSELLSSSVEFKSKHAIAVDFNTFKEDEQIVSHDV